MFFFWLLINATKSFLVSLEKLSTCLCYKVRNDVSSNSKTSEKFTSSKPHMGPVWNQSGIRKY